MNKGSFGCPPLKVLFEYFVASLDGFFQDVQARINLGVGGYEGAEEADDVVVDAAVFHDQAVLGGFLDDGADQFWIRFFIFFVVDEFQAQHGAKAFEIIKETVEELS